MIARSWTARASPEGATEYAAFFARILAPQLKAIPGHRGALVLDRAIENGQRELTVVTFWDDREAIARFAGATPDRAVVEAEAAALLTAFDTDVHHHQILVNALPEGG